MTIFLNLSTTLCAMDNQVLKFFNRDGIALINNLQVHSVLEFGWPTTLMLVADEVV